MNVSLKPHACPVTRFLKTWLWVALFICAHAGAQQTTLSARVKIVEGGTQVESSHAENVVVWLIPIDARAPTRSFPNHPLRLTQHNKSFEPHLLVVPFGAVVQFPNRDP